MSVAVQDLDLEALLVLAALDENTGTTDERARVIASRATLAQQHIQLPPSPERERMISTRARVATSLETIIPEVVIGERVTEAGYSS
jgi:hypothetical protein